MKERIAVVGTGISGLSLSYMLQNDYDLTIFEQSSRIGGHTATIDMDYQGQHYAVDTGFIVFNDWTYPNFIRIMNELGVDSKPTEMGFSLSCSNTGMEYSGRNLSTLFTQKRNLFRPSHWRMIRDILRFNKEAVDDLERLPESDQLTLGDYLSLKGYSAGFKDFYLVPMASAIWSSSLADVELMPLQFFVKFFKNHGLLSIKDRPQWRVIKGGSRSYIEPMIRGFERSIKLSCPVQSVRRRPDGVYIDSPHMANERFDQVVFACHSDQALGLIEDPSGSEIIVLRALPYSQNEVILHTDEQLLPRRKKAWSSWNYLLGRDQSRAVLTYHMNILQGIESDTSFLVTMNDTESIDPSKIIGRYQYAHPMFSSKGLAAQERWGEVNGVNRTWFCGAWWGNGFHEDGVVSAQRVVEGLQMQSSMQVA